MTWPWEENETAGSFWKCFPILENKTQQGFAPPSPGLCCVATGSHGAWSCQGLSWDHEGKRSRAFLRSWPQVLTSRSRPMKQPSNYRLQKCHGTREGSFLIAEAVSLGTQYTAPKLSDRSQAPGRIGQTPANSKKVCLGPANTEK